MWDERSTLERSWRAPLDRKGNIIFGLARVGAGASGLIAIHEHIRKDQLCDFTLRPWRKVTFALREIIAEYAKKNGEDNRIVTAMMLGFVAAAEQNLLEYSPAAPRRVSKNEPTLIPGDLIKYLRGDDK